MLRLDPPNDRRPPDSATVPIDDLAYAAGVLRDLLEEVERLKGLEGSAREAARL